MALDTLQVELTVVLGKARLPLRQLLRLGRGAIVPLEASTDDEVEILANDLPVARGRISVTGEAIGVEILSLIRKPDVTREPGATIGATLRAFPAA